MMRHTPIFQIYSCGDHYQCLTDSLPDMKALTKAAAPMELRRIGRFIQLAVIGAARCSQSTALPSDTGVYFASARGDLDLTVEIMTQMFRDGQTPKPLNFVNAVSNAPCFYLAQLLKLHSRSNFVCNHYFAFESVLQLALLDLSTHEIDSALVGSLDIASAPLSEHRQRLRLASDAPVGEGSHWLWIGAPSSERPHLGDVLAVKQFADRDALLSWCRELPRDSMAISRGQFVKEGDWRIIADSTPHEAEFDYRSERAYYDSQSGAVIGEFLRSDCKAIALLHINADDDGRYMAMLVRRAQ